MAITYRTVRGSRLETRIGFYCEATKRGPWGRWLDWLYVRPEWRGRGEAEELIGRSCDDADSRGQTLWLEAVACTSPDHQGKLLSLYQRFGFVVVGIPGCMPRRPYGAFMVRQPARVAKVAS